MDKGLLLKNGRVVDIAQGVDGVADVAIAEGKISAIGQNLEAAPNDEVLDLTGKIVCPGFFDIHVHAYGGIAFADPDSIGVNLGTTSMVDAGGAGAYTWDEFEALILGQTKTDIYLWLLMRAAGIYGFQDTWTGARSLIDIPINRMLDIVEGNRDRIVGLKMAEFAALGLGPMKIAKGVANVLELPLYVHIGELFESPPETYTEPTLNLLEAGDYVTHCYTPCPGNLIGKDGKVLPEALAARDRGVWFDLAFGGFNFSFDVAERLMDQGIVPSTISTDLQQINVTGPVYSLMHVMSALMAIGMSFEEVLQRVTVNPAEQLGLTEKAGTLKPGMPADVTVIEIKKGDFVFDDTTGKTRRGNQLIGPVVTIKAGEVIYPDRKLAEAESNWSIESSMSYDVIPSHANLLDIEQREFIGTLVEAFSEVNWEGVSLHEGFHRTRKQQGIDLRRAAEAVIQSFMTSRFTPPIGFFLATQDRDFVLSRLAQVAAIEQAIALN
ncbi:MAG TPA: amidohydrolase/deacetylase family metallohydrolase [Pyrinomonadaceae bacterium]|nr:amidohydrolase/deacetylase family metallohydrolase [Pyrinomonadaceae bacterium]